MSFPTFPNEDAGSGEPPPGGCACYPVGNTPDVQYLCLSGVMIGDLWRPADPPPPNGTYKMLKIDTCFWGLDIPPVSCFYQGAPDLSFAVCNMPGYNVFAGLEIPLCKYHFINMLQNPAVRVFYGGQAVVVSLMSDMTYSERDLQESIGFDPAAGSYARPHPFSPLQAVHVFSRALDHSNVHVLVDHS